MNCGGGMIVASKVSLDVVMPAVAWHKWSAELLKLSGGDTLNATRPAGIPAPGEKKTDGRSERCYDRGGGVCQRVGSSFFFKGRHLNQDVSSKM